MPRESDFNLQEFLSSGIEGTAVVTYQPRDIVYSQGDDSASVMYLQEGVVKLSVLSPIGQEAVVAILETSGFFGECALIHSVRRETATAMTGCTVLVVPRKQMTRLLHEQPALSDRFIEHMLARNARVEEDVLDQMFNSSEKRLARVLLLLAHHGQPGATGRVVPDVTQQTLANMVGTTRSRVNVFMNRFRKLGCIDWRDGLKVNDSLVTAVLLDDRAQAPWSKAS